MKLHIADIKEKICIMINQLVPLKLQKHKGKVFQKQRMYMESVNNSNLLTIAPVKVNGLSAVRFIKMLKTNCYEQHAMQYTFSFNISETFKDLLQCSLFNFVFHSWYTFRIWRTIKVISIVRRNYFSCLSTCTLLRATTAEERAEHLVIINLFRTVTLMTPLHSSVSLKLQDDDDHLSSSDSNLLLSSPDLVGFTCKGHQLQDGFSLFRSS